jgi:hypothetical protein
MVNEVRREIHGDRECKVEKLQGNRKTNEKSRGQQQHEERRPEQGSAPARTTPVRQKREQSRKPVRLVSGVFFLPGKSGRGIV